MTMLFPFTYGTDADDLTFLPDEVGPNWTETYEEDTSEMSSMPRTTVEHLAHLRLSERDRVILRFIIRYGYTNLSNLAYLVGTKPDTLKKRMRQLALAGLVNPVDMVRGVRVFLPTKFAQEYLGYSFQVFKRPPFALFQHTIGLSTLGAELEREFPDSRDMFGFGQRGESFPQQRRFTDGRVLWKDGWTASDLTWGEMTLTEREVRKGQQMFRGGRSTRELREDVLAAAEDETAPELEDGNQGLFVVYGDGGKTGEHVPDLVITRAREGGKPAHVAVELELSLKGQKDYVRILRAYRAAGWMYESVVWVTPKVEIANALRSANESVGLQNLVIRKYVPRDSDRLFLG